MFHIGPRNLLLALLIAVLVASVGGAGTGAAEQPAGAAPAAPTLLPAGKQYTVTLLTGDVVTVQTRPQGCPLVSVRPAKPSGVLHRNCGPDGHVRVVPAQAAALIGSVLDEALFDVTTLILEGHDDARAKDIPLIVRQGSGPQARQSLTAGLDRTRELASIGAVAGRRPKAKAAEFTTMLSQLTTARTATGSGTRVWLDRQVRATAEAGGAGLDANLRQVRAPQAWAAGFTGRGAKVAVLDTGVDFTHPDLKGRVTQWADFSTEDGDGVDRFGHGTHVAATIAGTGAASGGARRGVAPEADLVIGKVLDDYGYGTDSQIIAGMEWAATRADVINMSLGGWEPSDGTDPLSLAVDALTEQHGALFVVAAGNDGPADGTVSWPAAAASALTVGAVDAADVPADFSGRGPLVNTWAAKPELVAPGVEIVAARAAGTGIGRVIDARYTAVSGTSMAAPHVAGAAAILAQRHPDWRPAQYKAALVGASEPLAGADPYTVGAGRLNVVRALSGAVSEQPVVNLGTFPYPQSGIARTTLSWSNTSAEPAKLRFSVAVTDRHGTAVPRTATLSASSAVLAPGAKATVGLRIDRSRLAAAPGLYTAVVTAHTFGGGFVSSTPVTFYVEPPSYDLTLTSTPLPQTPEGSDVYVSAIVVNLDDRALYARRWDVPPGETVTARVPAGRYSIVSSIWDLGEASSRMGLVGDPDVTVAADTAFVLDGARAKPVTAAVDGVETVANAVGLTYEQVPRHGPGWSDFAFAWGADAGKGSVFATPTDGPGVGTFDAYASYSLVAPGDGPSPFLYDLIRPLGHRIPDDLAYRVGVAEQARLARIDQRFHLLDKEDTYVGHKRYGYSPTGGYIAEADTHGLSGDRVDYVTPDYSWKDEAFYDANIGYGVVTQESLRRYEPGSRQQKVWVRQPLRPDWYDDPAPSSSGCRPAPVSRTRGVLHVELVDLTDEHQRFDCLGWGDGWSETTRTLTLHRNGVLLGQYPESFGDFAIPAAAGAYRLTYDLDASVLLPVSTRVTTAWTFRSAGPAGTGSAPVALLSVDYALPLDVANRPTGGAAEFKVRQAHGVPRQDVTSFRLWTSLDDGATWQPAAVTARGDGFGATLPTPSAGQSVSLRVKVAASAGSAVEQTIIRAYRAG
ncbi:S8 family serine peptidase [Catellatospora coxensis]|uniref:Serine protease n=1 Tax=Catellatospora coxensis TaxID=310354 RepID=A0A8J3KRA8_9ACTN|nr:S8 family serine peptidase [Catellatospora coxensis]GIG04798.1 serine protease [Catellatospora coxensis]